MSRTSAFFQSERLRTVPRLAVRITLCFLLGPALSSAGVHPICDENRTKEDVGLKPDDLVKHFLAKESGGEFLALSPWLRKAHWCPERFEAEKAFVGRPIGTSTRFANSEVKVVEVRYEILGAVDLKLKPLRNFETSRQQIRTVTHLVRKTPHGWKLDLQDQLSVVTPQTAAEKFGPFDADSEKALALTKR